MADSTCDTKQPTLSLTLNASDLEAISDGVDMYITTNSISSTTNLDHRPLSYSYYTNAIDTYSTPLDVWKAYNPLDGTIANYSPNKEGDKKDMTDKKEESLKAKWEKWNKSKFTPERIVYNPPATIVFWKDKTKTVVKCSEGEEYNEYFGFLAALGKKIFDTNSEVNRIVNKYKPVPKEEPKPEPKPKAKPVVKKKKESKKK